MPVVEAVQKVVRLSVLVRGGCSNQRSRYFFYYSDSLLLYDKCALLADFEIIFRYDAS